MWCMNNTKKRMKRVMVIHSQGDMLVTMTARLFVMQSKTFYDIVMMRILVKS